MADIFWPTTEERYPSFTAAEFSDSGIFRTFFDRSGLRAARLDDRARVVEASVDFGHDFGRPVAELRGQALPDLLHPSVRGQVGQQLARLLDGDRNRFCERVLALRNGTSVFAGELTGLAVHGDAGLVDGAVVLLRPELEQRSAVVVGRKALSKMDARILEGVAAGASTIQLAATLHLSCGGVEYHLTALLRSMKVRNRSALVSKAYSMGFFCVGSWPPRVLPDYVA